ncbi:MAG: hypothetical protein E6Q97_04295 [Desulfurellales bacterium]|nr:MAG: hypothetical protein E6Q97_04295 [Desulfurellales bacterium]
MSRMDYVNWQEASDDLTSMADICETCGMAATFKHDHKPDNSGLDDGPPLHHERKKPAPKSVDEMREIRARAWATRREKLGPKGHR